MTYLELKEMEELNSLAQVNGFELFCHPVAKRIAVQRKDDACRLFETSVEVRVFLEGFEYGRRIEGFEGGKEYDE